MVSKKQKQELLNALKFTPRDISVTLSGYGGELVIGRITEAAYDYWSQRQDALADFVYDWHGQMQDVPADARFCTDGSWYDVDDVCHESGVEFAAGSYITVTDELTGETLLESRLEPQALEAAGIEIDATDEIYIHDLEAGECVFLGQTIEKGVFFDGVITIREPFDPSRLRLAYGDYEGWQIGCSVEYAGEDIDGSGGYSTTGKGSDFKVIRNEPVEKDWDPKAELDRILEDFPLIEGEEMWAQEAIDSEPETWNGIPLTKWWPGNFEPYHRGEYEVFAEESNWPFPQRARWTGKRWLADGIMIAVKRWRGLSRKC